MPDYKPMQIGAFDARGRSLLPAATVLPSPVPYNPQANPEAAPVVQQPPMIGAMPPAGGLLNMNERKAIDEVYPGTQQPMNPLMQLFMNILGGRAAGAAELSPVEQRINEATPQAVFGAAMEGAVPAIRSGMNTIDRNMSAATDYTSREIYPAVADMGARAGQLIGAAPIAQQGFVPLGAPSVDRGALGPALVHVEGAINPTYAASAPAVSSLVSRPEMSVQNAPVQPVGPALIPVSEPGALTPVRNFSGVSGSFPAIGATGRFTPEPAPAGLDPVEARRDLGRFIQQDRAAKDARPSTFDAVMNQINRANVMPISEFTQGAQRIDTSASAAIVGPSDPHPGDSPTKSLPPGVIGATAADTQYFRNDATSAPIFSNTAAGALPGALIGSAPIESDAQVAARRSDIYNADGTPKMRDYYGNAVDPQLAIDVANAEDLTRRLQASNPRGVPAQVTSVQGGSAASMIANSGLSEGTKLRRLQDLADNEAKIQIGQMSNAAELAKAQLAADTQESIAEKSRLNALKRAEISAAARSRVTEEPNPYVDTHVVGNPSPENKSGVVFNSSQGPFSGSGPSLSAARDNLESNKRKAFASKFAEAYDKPAVRAQMEATYGTKDKAKLMEEFIKDGVRKFAVRQRTQQPIIGAMQGEDEYGP